MSKTRKIAGSVNLRIRLGDWEHLEFVKYAEEQITYENDDERIAQEDKLHVDLMDLLMRSVKEGAKKLGMDGIAVAQEIEQKMQKRIPEWLEKGEVPNIAGQNQAEKRLNQVADKQQDIVDKQKESDNTVKNTFEGADSNTVVNPAIKSEPVDKNALFEDDEPASAPLLVDEVKTDVNEAKPEAKPEATKPTPSNKSDSKSNKRNIEDDFSILDDDDDLFKNA